MDEPTTSRPLLTKRQKVEAMNKALREVLAKRKPQPPGPPPKNPSTSSRAELGDHWPLYCERPQCQPLPIRLWHPPIR